MKDEQEHVSTAYVSLGFKNSETPNKVADNPTDACNYKQLHVQLITRYVERARSSSLTIWFLFTKLSFKIWKFAVTWRYPLRALHYEWN